MTNILNNMSFQELLNQMVLTHKFYLEHQISITNANSNYNFFPIDVDIYSHNLPASHESIVYEGIFMQ